MPCCRPIWPLYPPGVRCAEVWYFRHTSVALGGRCSNEVGEEIFFIGPVTFCNLQGAFSRCLYPFKRHQAVVQLAPFGREYLCLNHSYHPKTNDCNSQQTPETPHACKIIKSNYVCQPAPRAKAIYCGRTCPIIFSIAALLVIAVRYCPVGFQPSGACRSAMALHNTLWVLLTTAISP